MSRKFAALLGALTTVLMSSASLAQNLEPFPGDDPELIALMEAAQAEGQLSIYTAQDNAQTTKSVAAFEQAVPGIAVTFLRPGASNAVINRFSQETVAGVHQADVINTQIAALYKDNPEWFQPMTDELVPTLSEIPQQYVHERYVQTQQQPLVFSYNTEHLAPEDVPTTWEELVNNPNLKGRGLMADPRNSNNYVMWLDVMQKEFGDEWLTKFKELELRAVSGGSQASQEIAAGGSGPVYAVPVFTTHTRPVMDKGAPLAMVLDLDRNSGIPPVVNVANFAIPANAPNPNAARLFVAWLLTVEGQQSNCTPGANASLLLTEETRGECLEPYEEFVLADGVISDERKTHLLTQIGLQ